MEKSPFSSLLHIRLLASLLLVLALQSTVLGQEFIGDPRFEISGPSGQVVLVTTRYFEKEQIVRTEEKRIRISSGPAEPSSLEIGYDGFRVLVTSPTKAAIRLRLKDGEELVEEKQSRGVETVAIGFGSARAVKASPTRSIRLSEQEAVFVRGALRTIANGETKELVSAKEFANIDWPTLDAFCSSLASTWGAAQPDLDKLDGWTSWPGSMGAKVFSGPLSYGAGTCFFTLMSVEGKLVDVLVEGDGLPEFWFAGPADNAPYIARADALTRLMFLGQLTQARSVFSPRVREDITVDTLQNIHKDLKSSFDSSVTKIEFKKAILGDYDDDGESRPLRIIHLIELGSKRCLSLVDFEFLCGPQKIGRGDLVGVNFRETWPSSQPRLVELAREALPLITTGAGFDRYGTLYHEQAKDLLSEQEFGEIAANVPGVVGKLSARPVWDLWRANGSGAAVFAEGPVQFENGTFNLHFDFAEDQLLGFSITGEQSSASTLGAIQNKLAYEEVGARFWKAVLESRSSDGYELLSGDFRAQLNRSQFIELINESRLAKQQPVEIEFIGARLSDRLDRPYAVMVSAYFMARRDSERLTLRVEFDPASDSGTEPKIVDFSSGFATRFPTARSEPLANLLDALRQADSAALLALLPERDRAFVNAKVLNAFLKQASKLLADCQPRLPVYAMNFFQNGNYEQKYAASMLGEKKEIPIWARFRFGELIGFEIVDPEIQHYGTQLVDEAIYTDVASAFVEGWFLQQNKAEGWLQSGLRTQETARSLRTLRESILGLDGAFRAASASVYEWSNAAIPSPIVEVVLDYGSGETSLILEMELTAFGARIKGIATKDAFLKQKAKIAM